jgi:cytochrome c oxidase cbb3-type subunit 3
MGNRTLGGAATLLWFASLLFASMRWGQAATAEKPKTANAQEKGAAKKPNGDDAVAAMMGIPPIDKEAAERGRKIFVPTCGFCHGIDARGKSGPDLVRSPLALHDKKGDVLGPVIQNGRPDRGMPAFSNLSAEQIADISVFLHSMASDVSNRFAYKIGDLITGDAQRGEAFFNGEGHCASCHSASGDLAHVATKCQPVELQRRMLYPAPNVIDVLLGKVMAPSSPAKVTVQLASGERVSGTLEHQDEFTVAMRDSAGWYRSFLRESLTTVDVQDPRAAHEELLPKYSDQKMHDILTYLETLK